MMSAAPTTTHEVIRPTVLVAEDDRLTRMLLVRTFLKWNLDVLEAADGDEALASISDNTVDLVVTDWEMPGTDGPELCRRVRRDLTERYVYIIMLTSHLEQDHLVAGLDAGADDYITKPFDPVELRARLDVGRRFIELDRRWRATEEQLRRANSMLEERAATDGLTGLGNRRAFDEALTRFHARALRHETSYGLVMIDVDHFKAYNDNYGHPAGDEVLRQIATALRDTTRTGDEVFRYGGEEIVVLLAWCPGACVGIVAERMCATVRDAAIPHEHAPPGVVTVSIGGASFVPPINDSMTAEEILERADHSLYRAKDGGRDRADIWIPPEYE